MYDLISLTLCFPAKPALIALCVVGSVAVLAIIVAIIVCSIHRKKSHQGSFSNGKFSWHGTWQFGTTDNTFSIFACQPFCAYSRLNQSVCSAFGPNGTSGQACSGFP